MEKVSKKNIPRHVPSGNYNFVKKLPKHPANNNKQDVETRQEEITTIKHVKEEIKSKEDGSKEEMSERAARRRLIVKEMFDSETVYLDQLKTVIVSFLSPLQLLAKDKPALAVFSSLLFQNTVQLHDLHWVPLLFSFFHSNININ